MIGSPDVIIVGGGVIGCGVAYELARRSVQVTLIDKTLPGRATSASAGGLWPVGESVGLGCGVIYHNTMAAQHESDNNGNAVENVSGLVILPEIFRKFLQNSNRLFPELSQELLELTGVDIEYEPGAGLLYLIYQEQDFKLTDQLKQLLPDMDGLTVLSPEETWKIEPHLTRDLLGAVLLPGEYQVNPMLLAEAFKRAAIELGATCYHDVHVDGLERHGDRVTGVNIDGQQVSCGAVVNAAGCWSARLAATAELSLPVFPVRGQIVLTESLPHTLNACLSTNGCYLVQKNHGEVLIGSTTENVGFDTSVTVEAMQSLVQASVRGVPLLQDVGIKRIWSGLRPGTPDELPVLGPVDEVSGYFNATGGFRTGIVASPLTARVVAQCVLSEETEFERTPFLAARFGNQVGSPIHSGK